MIRITMIVESILGPPTYQHYHMSRIHYRVSARKFVQVLCYDMSCFAGHGGWEFTLILNPKL